MMKCKTLFLLGAALGPFGAFGQEAEQLFNGRDLTGWDGDPRLWSVVDGVLVGESNDTDKKVAANTFLIWKGGEVTDFDLKLTARAAGNNSGVQYRSKVLDPATWSVGGYQMDMHPKQDYLAMLYEERGRGIQCLRGEKVVLGADGAKEVVGKVPLPEVDLAQFNEYAISARGNVVQHFINGELAAEITDNNPEKRSLAGVLALQLHQGSAMKVEVKEITLRKVGAAPRPEEGKKEEPQPPQDATSDFQVAKDFKLEKLYTVPKAQGSWVAITVLPDGRFITCDQYGGMYEVRAAAAGLSGGGTEVRALDLPIGGAHGLLWHRGALYVSVNERGKGEKKNGVYRVTDADGDGELETIASLKEIAGGGEHGLHSLVPSPDGEWIYLICGNHTSAPEVDHLWMSKNWGEDHLLPRNPDGRGHAHGVMAPGGWIARFKPDNSRWELVSNGFRNPYDLAFNQHGDLFAYDADMEWDLGMPWYRPTRLSHVVPASEWGWRNGTGKWPSYYEDSLPPVVDIGPGSPTGVLSGLGGKFPAKYQKAIFLLDWTFATIYAIHLAPDGPSYTGTKEEFVAGSGLPLTDAAFGNDGAMYFLTGGRRTASALWRVSYTGSEDTSPVARDTAGSPLPELVSELREAPLPRVLEAMGSEDRFERFLARVEGERRPIGELKEAIGAAGNPWVRIGGAIAVARQGAKEDRGAALGWLNALGWNELSKAQKLGLLRAYGLLFTRLGAPGEEEWKQVIGQLDGVYPAGDAELDAELCVVLCYLQAPEVVERTLRLMVTPKETNWPDWAELAARNSGYGRDVLEMLRNTPSAQDIHYAFCLRNVKGPWTDGQRSQIMRWYSEVQIKSGGKSYGLFLEKMKKDMLENATTEERAMIAEWTLPQPKSPFEGLPTAKGPGRDWSAAEVARIGAGDLGDTDLENGKKMFHATLCAACHRIRGEGGSAGPDLSALGGRFSVGDLADALVDPNKVVSDQYTFEILSLKDKSSLWGRVMEEKDGVLAVATSAFDFTKTREVARSEVLKIEPSPISPMPAGLINSLNESELRDLLGYLLQK